MYIRVIPDDFGQNLKHSLLSPTQNFDIFVCRSVTNYIKVISDHFCSKSPKFPMIFVSLLSVVLEIRLFGMSGIY